MHTEFVNLEFTHYSEIFMRVVKIFQIYFHRSLPDKRNTTDQETKYSAKKLLQLHFECLCAFMTLCKQFVSKMCRGMGFFVTKSNFICHGHVMHQTSEMWHHKGGKLLQVKGEDKPDCSVWLFVAPPIMNPHSVQTLCQESWNQRSHHEAGQDQ